MIVMMQTTVYIRMQMRSVMTLTMIVMEKSMRKSSILGVTYYIDSDGDGFGNPDISMMACSLPEGYSEKFR